MTKMDARAKPVFSGFQFETYLRRNVLIVMDASGPFTNMV